MLCCCCFFVLFFILDRSDGTIFHPELRSGR
jgi:hypothetical protein